METSARIGSTGMTLWTGLYKVAGIATFVMVAFIPIQIAVFLIYPLPDTVVGWFDLFQSNKLAGLLDMDLLLMIDQIIVGLVMVALYIALRSTSPSMMTIALTLGLLGVGIYFASTAAFEMLSLSSRYAASTTESERDAILAAGQATLVAWQGTAFNFSYIMEGVSLVVIGFVMLKSAVFSHFTALVGVVTGFLSLIPPTVPVIGMYFAFASLVPLIVWDVLIARRFLRLAKQA